MKNEKIFERFISNIERDLMFYIISNLKHEFISVHYAEKLSKEFLAAINGKSEKEILMNLRILSEKYKEIRDVYLKYQSLFLEEERKKAIKNINSYLKKGKIEKAIRKAKSANSLG